MKAKNITLIWKLFIGLSVEKSLMCVFSEKSMAKAIWWTQLYLNTIDFFCGEGVSCKSEAPLFKFFCEHTFVAEIVITNVDEKSRPKNNAEMFV